MKEADCVLSHRNALEGELAGGVGHTRAGHVGEAVGAHQLNHGAAQRTGGHAVVHHTVDARTAYAST